MENIVGNMGLEDDINQDAYMDASKRQKEGSEGPSERKGVKAQYRAEKQPETVYDTVSSHGDTLSISEAGMAANSEKDNEPGHKDASDGIVIRKEVKGNVQDMMRKSATEK